MSDEKSFTKGEVKTIAFITVLATWFVVGLVMSIWSDHDVRAARNEERVRMEARYCAKTGGTLIKDAEGGTTCVKFERP